MKLLKATYSDKNNKDKLDKAIFDTQSGKLNSTVTRLLLLLPMLVLSACGDSAVEKLDQKIAAANEARRGVYVTLGPDLRQAIAIADSRTEIKLTRIATDISNENSEYKMNLIVKDGVASGKPPKAEPKEEFLYTIQVSYQQASGGNNTPPLILAEASKISDKSRVEFSANELLTAPYDLDGDGNIDASEKAALDFDGDSRSNLEEIVEGGNPQNSAPTFVSPGVISLAENEDTGGYIFHTAKAISPSADENGNRLAIRYGINTENSDIGVGLLSIDPMTGELLKISDKKLPAYIPNGNNVYVIVLTAADSRGKVGEQRLTLTITDVFNLTVSVSSIALLFQWANVVDLNGDTADFYLLLQDIHGNNNFIAVSRRNQQGNRVPIKIRGTTKFSYMLDQAITAVPKPETQYKLEAYLESSDPDNTTLLLTTSAVLTLNNTLKFPEGIIDMIAYLKASNAGGLDGFGKSIALSADGNTLVVGSPTEDGGPDGKGHLPDNCGDTLSQLTSCERNSGAVYIFQRQVDGKWLQQSYLKASNAEENAMFGGSVALSANGNTLVVGAAFESGGADSSGSSIYDCYPIDELNCQTYSGAVYLFQRGTDNRWLQQAYIKASNSDSGDNFGQSVSLSSDGNSLAVGATGESSDIGINAGPVDDCVKLIGVIPVMNNCQRGSGAVYVYLRQPDNNWLEQAYLKASNAQPYSKFGTSVALSLAGNTLVVGASSESSSPDSGGWSKPVCIAEIKIDCLVNSGSAYVFQRQITGEWVQQDYIKASNAGGYDSFGGFVSLSANGNTLAVGATGEGSGEGVNGGPVDDCTEPLIQQVNCFSLSGAVYVYQRQADNSWSQQAYLKASYVGAGYLFGSSVALSADGKSLAVGSKRESSSIDTNGGPIADCGGTFVFVDNANCKYWSGAVYVYQLENNDSWRQKIYLKAANDDVRDNFGASLAYSTDGKSLAVGATGESASGAVYVY